MSPRPEAAVYVEAAMTAPELVPLAAGRVAIFSAPCPPGDRPSEDAAVLVPLDEQTAVLAVADGAGGAPKGGTAARLAIEGICSALQDAETSEGSWREWILDGFERANRAVMDLAVGAATTLAVVEIGDGWMRPYHAGDSAILLTGQRGRLKLQTVMHSPTGYAVEAGLLHEADALQHEDRNVVSNMVGSPAMRVEMGSPHRLSPHDTIVVGTDGLFDNLESAEVIDCIRTGPIEAAAVRLAERCLARMTAADRGHPSKPDDLTFALFRPARRRAGPRSSR